MPSFSIKTQCVTDLKKYWSKLSFDVFQFILKHFNNLTFEYTKIETTTNLIA